MHMAHNLSVALCALSLTLSSMAAQAQPSSKPQSPKDASVPPIAVERTVEGEPVIVQDTSNPAFRTTRERLKAHLDDEECASCHKLTDPMGLTLESFDGAGQFRATENGVSIDTTGMLDQIAFNDSAGLGKALHDNPKVTQCLTQSAWRYAAGRALLPSEEPVTNRLHEDFARTGYRIRSLFRRIAVDPQFFAVRSPVASRVASKPSSGRKG